MCPAMITCTIQINIYVPVVNLPTCKVCVCVHACVYVCIFVCVCVYLHNLHLTTHITLVLITIYFLTLLLSADYVDLQPITGLYMTKH